jgi:hypothetical protein
VEKEEEVFGIKGVAGGLFGRRRRPRRVAGASAARRNIDVDDDEKVREEAKLIT